MIGYMLLIAGIVLFDQLVKYAAATQLTQLPGKTMEFIPGFMDFTYVENTGAAFNMFSGATWILGVISLVLAGVIIYLMFRFKNIRSRLFMLALAFIAGGALGNVVDRFFRGFVVDMLEFTFVDFAVFNVADSFVSIGAVMLAVYIIWFWDKGKNKKEIADGQPEE
ncbi:MAG: signal peptidase II [Christensenellaceae bacterium]